MLGFHLLEFVVDLVVLAHLVLFGFQLLLEVIGILLEVFQVLLDLLLLALRLRNVAGVVLGLLSLAHLFLDWLGCWGFVFGFQVLLFIEHTDLLCE